MLPIEILSALLIGEDMVIVQIRSIGFQSGKLTSKVLVFG